MKWFSQENFVDFSFSLVDILKILLRQKLWLKILKNWSVKVFIAININLRRKMLGNGSGKTSSKVFPQKFLSHYLQFRCKIGYFRIFFCLMLLEVNIKLEVKSKSFLESFFLFFWWKNDSKVEKAWNIFTFLLVFPLEADGVKLKLFIQCQAWIASLSDLNNLNRSKWSTETLTSYNSQTFTCFHHHFIVT